MLKTYIRYICFSFYDIDIYIYIIKSYIRNIDFLLYNICILKTYTRYIGFAIFILLSSNNNNNNNNCLAGEGNITFKPTPVPHSQYNHSKSTHFHKVFRKVCTINFSRKIPTENESIYQYCNICMENKGFSVLRRIWRSGYSMELTEIDLLGFQLLLKWIH